MGEITVALVGGSEFDRQRSVEVGVRVQAAGVLILRYGLALHCRVMYRECDQSPTLVREGMYDRQCCCRPDVPDYAFVLVFNAWMETETRRVSCPFRGRCQFLIKDVVLLGAVLWSLGEAMTATREPAPEA